MPQEKGKLFEIAHLSYEQFRTVKTSMRMYVLRMDKQKNSLPKLPQPPVAYSGATPDSDRAKPPKLDTPALIEEVVPGDRVEGLGNFGKPTGEIGTVEQANEEEAVVKWDDDGRMRLRQPWLNKVKDDLKAQ